MHVLGEYTGIQDLGYSSQYPVHGTWELGDDSAQLKSGHVQPDNADKWQEDLSDPLLHRVLSAYLESLGEELLRTLGYEKSVLAEILASAADKYQHTTGPDELSVAGFSPKEFFSSEGTRNTHSSWWKLRKRMRGFESQLATTTQALKEKQNKFDEMAQRLLLTDEKLLYTQSELCLLRESYGLLARSKWVRLGHKLNSPISALKKIFKNSEN